MEQPKYKWMIYYADGSIFTDVDGEPDDAPPMGVQAIACDDGLWLGGDIIGLIDYLCRKGTKKVVRFGTHVANWKFTPAVTKARTTTDISPDRTILERYDYYWWEGETYGNC